MLPFSRRFFSSSSSTHLPRSLYVAKLRRAFLLRVHPDRFRSLSPQVRKRQATLVHALSDRLTKPDFVAYTCDEGIDSTRVVPTFGTFDFVMEHKDSSIVQHVIRLDESVESVLKNMVSALNKATSSISMPPPPPTPTTSASSQNRGSGSNHHIHWSPSHEQYQTTTTTRRGVNHKYDRNSHAGRDLMKFIENMDFELIEERRASRMDVTAVALVARRAFSFLSVDGTGLGWSSASFAVLLQSLVELHEEHSSKFHVQSFYPLQLVWSSEDFDNPIDLYGGILYLNPASTPIMWLDTFLSITQATLDKHAENQALLNKNRSKVMGAFGGVKFLKGHSCSHKAFHDFLSRLATTVSNDVDDIATDNDNTKSTALTLESIVVTVEASCRRAILTKEGTIRVGASVDAESIARAISKHSLEAAERTAAEAQRKQQCREMINQCKWELGLLKVYQTTMVQTDQIRECLVRLLAMQEQREQIKRSLAGNSLGVAASGQFCHLGDDGSVVIPWDWR